MATLTAISNPTPVTALPPATSKISGLTAGEAIIRGDFCYIKSDGLVWKSNGTADTAPAKCRGMALESAAVGEAVTLGFDMQITYSTGLTPGAEYYVSATAGKLDDAATTGGKSPVAFAVNTTDIWVLQRTY